MKIYDKTSGIYSMDGYPATSRREWGRSFLCQHDITETGAEVRFGTKSAGLGTKPRFQTREADLRQKTTQKTETKNGNKILKPKTIMVWSGMVRFRMVQNGFTAAALLL